MPRIHEKEEELVWGYLTIQGNEANDLVEGVMFERYCILDESYLCWQDVPEEYGCFDGQECLLLHQDPMMKCTSRRKILGKHVNLARTCGSGLEGQREPRARWLNVYAQWNE